MLSSRPSSRGTLAASALGLVVVLLDVSVVNVALEALRQKFSTDVAGLQWVVNAYTLAFAALLLTSGAMGDRFGARRVFSWGLILFTLASLICGLTDELSGLVAARLLQGVGAAMLVPNRWTHIRLIAAGSRIALLRDGAPLFELDDPSPYTNGHFGFRTTKSHLRIANFRVMRPAL